VDEWLINSVEVGTFELPPIPLARLPASQRGLPKQASPPAHLRWLQDLYGHLPHTATHGGVPFYEYDRSNCHPGQALDARIPPLPPAACRLPRRSHHDLRSLRPTVEVAAAVEQDAARLQHVLAVWTAPQATPMLLCLAGREDAVRACELLLQCRGVRLDQCEQAGAAKGSACSGS